MNNASYLSGVQKGDDDDSDGVFRKRTSSQGITSDYGRVILNGGITQILSVRDAFAIKKSQ